MAKQTWQDSELAVGAMSQPDAVRVFMASRQPAEQNKRTWPGSAGIGYPTTRVAPSRSRLSTPIGAALFVR